MYLYLLRHAEAEPDLHNSDTNRKLTNVGIHDALLLNEFILEKNLQFDLVLSSTTTRTRETTNIILKNNKDNPNIQYLDKLYQATENVISKIINQNSSKNVLIIGHNPGISQTICLLRNEYYRSYPPCTFGCFVKDKIDDDFQNITLIKPKNGIIVDIF